MGRREQIYEWSRHEHVWDGLISQLVRKLKDKFVPNVHVKQCSRKCMLIAQLDSLSNSLSPMHFVAMVKKESLKNLTEEPVILDHKNAR